MLHKGIMERSVHLPWTQRVQGSLLSLRVWHDVFFFLKELFIYFNWRLITLQYCSGFCHTLTWISHGCTWCLNIKFVPMFIRNEIVQLLFETCCFFSFNVMGTLFSCTIFGLHCIAIVAQLRWWIYNWTFFRAQSSSSLLLAELHLGVRFSLYITR